MVVNVASRCGYTYQYESLQNLYDKYKDNGFVVLGVPSRDFMQEYSVESDVAEFCSTEYGVSFPMFATSKVRGSKATPLYKKLIAQTGKSPTWNFNKYLISREGVVVSTFGSQVKPDSLELVKEGQSVKLKQGQAAFFASFIRHRVAPVTKGVRRSLVMWFGGPPFK